MARSVWKVPNVHPSLIRDALKHSKGEIKGVIKTYCRSSMIIPAFVDKTFSVYNGKVFVPVSVNEDMVGHKLGEFSPTRVFKGHAGNKQASKKGGS